VTPDTTGDRPCGCRVGTADRCARCATAPQLRAVVAAPVDERAELRGQVARLEAELAAALESARTIRAATLREHALDQLDLAQAMVDGALAVLRAQP
jgi:hypothetical protein